MSSWDPQIQSGGSEIDARCVITEFDEHMVFIISISQLPCLIGHIESSATSAAEIVKRGVS